MVMENEVEKQNLIVEVEDRQAWPVAPNANQGLLVYFRECQGDIKTDLIIFSSTIGLGLFQRCQELV